ncbi:DUF3299 domain-containing protein [Planktotalea sp.]|uniref:DUF3299 domain-containing protein n=1 Tax=Planktotalea sp. TaxID=2029877 RepID=UPI0032976CE5
MLLSRRQMISAAAASAALPRLASASTVMEITWDDLIPPGVPYSEIIGQGEIDEINDTWNPIYDENANKLNPLLNGTRIKMPGYIVPLDLNTKGVTSFILVPYVGACIHTPPPPPNQLVYVTTENPWPGDDLWEAVWVTGHMKHETQSTEIAETGYTLTAEAMETYVW